MLHFVHKNIEKSTKINTPVIYVLYYISYAAMIQPFFTCYVNYFVTYLYIGFIV